MKIGDRIKEIRKSLNFSQKDFANKLNIPISTLANYENNHRQPNIETLKNIANGLNVNFSDLIEDDEILEDMRGNDFLRAAEFLQEYGYQINQINENGIDKVEISNLDHGTLLVLEENDFINKVNFLIDDINDLIKLQIKQFIARN